MSKPEGPPSAVPAGQAPPGDGERAAGPPAASALHLSVGRHPRDVVRLLAATAALAGCVTLSLLPGVNPVELAIFDDLSTMPRGANPMWAVLVWFGSWAAIAGVTAVALYLKRIRLGLECAGAGVLAWGLARVANGALGPRPVPAAVLDQLAGHSPTVGVTILGGQVAIAAALSTVTGPYVTRTVGYLAWTTTVLVGLAAIATGDQLPLGALTGGVLGWGCGAVFHLVLGAPGRRTSHEGIRRQLDLAGLQPDVLTPVKQHHVFGPQQFAVQTADGDCLRVDVVRRIRRRAGLVYKVRRLLASLEVQDEPQLSTTHHEVEHEAFVTLLAERAGVRTPAVVLACQPKHGSPLLVRREITARPLNLLATEEIDDDLLTSIWRQLAALGDARIAHHDLRAKNILVDPERRPWLVGFTFGRPGATAAACAQDLAEALVSLASVAGVERTVRTAGTVLPPDRLREALQYLQGLAMPRRIRAQAEEGRLLFTDLRETLAERLDCPLPGFRSPVRPSSVIGLLLLGAAVYLLLPQLSSMGQVVRSLRTANWGWLAVATATGLLAIVLSAVSLLGSSHVRLPVWRTILVQIGAAFTGRTTPGGAGFFGINIAYLEGLGIRRSRAVGVTVLNLAGTGLVSTVACVVGVFGVGASGVLRDVHLPPGWTLLVLAAAVLIVVGVLLGSPFGRRRILHPSLEAARDLLSTVHHPVRALQLFGGAFGYLVVSGFGLVACLAAFHSVHPLLAVITVFMVAQTLGHLAPAPGGLGAVEAVMAAGLTAIGIAPAAAVAAVLTSRLLTYWLPVLPGIAAFRYLQHHGII